MTIKVGINGFGRIGRQVYRAIREHYPDRIDVVAVNDVGNRKIMTRLQSQPELPTGDHGPPPPGVAETPHAFWLRDDSHAAGALLPTRRVLVQPHGRATLDVGPSPAVAERFARLDRLMAA